MWAFPTPKKILAIPLAFFLLALIPAGCAVNPVTGEKELMLVSEAQEVEMGSHLYPNALWGAEGGGGEFRDLSLQSYLKDVIARLHRVSHRPNLPVDFAIQNSSVPNAWAIPGHVVVTRGLLSALGSEAEFAFVMGHEIGHVSARHAARQMTRSIFRQMGLAAAGVALKDREYSDALLTAGAIGSTIALLKYGRNDELEADRLGLVYMSRLGYDPENAISAHRNLERAVEDYLKSVGRKSREGGAFEELLSTHPRTSVRVEELEKMKNALEPVALKGDGTGKGRFNEAVAGLEKVNMVYREYYDRAAASFRDGRLNEAEDLASRAMELDKNQPPFHALRGFIMLERKGFKDAAGYFNSALDLDPGYQPAYRGLGSLNYMEGDYREGMRYLKEALRLFPEDASSHYFLGMSYYKTARYREALPHLGAFADSQPRHPRVHAILGICYENTGEIRSAYNEYLLQLRVAPNNDMGRYARERVMALKPLIERPKRK